MIVEQRTYRLVAGAMADYLRRYEAQGLDIQRRILGEPMGCFTTDTGALNQVIHLWSYADYADRERRRGALAQDASWSGYLRSVEGLVRSQYSQILVPAPFMASRQGWRAHSPEGGPHAAP